MRLPSRRALAHATAALLLSAGAVVAYGSPGHADDATGDSTTVLKPDVFEGHATASSIHFFFDRTPAFSPFQDLFHVEVPYATSVMTSSGDISATSSPLYPGGALVSLPALLCGQFVPCGFTPPAYPAIANASYPNTPDASAETSLGDAAVGGILHISPSIAEAHADANTVDSHTTVQTTTLLDAGSVDSVSTHSEQYFKNGALITLATSDASGINLFGGALHIDSISSIAQAVLGGGNKPQVTLNTTVAGATLEGNPITIDDTGIHLATQGDKGAVLGGFNKALAQLGASGVSIRLGAADKTVTKQNISASTAGLLITFNNNAPDLPLPIPPLPLPVALPGTGGDYIGSISIGGAGVTSYATNISTSPGGTTIGGITTSPGGTPVSVGGSTPDTTATGPIDTSLNPPATVGTQSPTLAGGGGKTATLVADTTFKKLKTLAGALILYPALLLLARLITLLAGGFWRAPSRLPRAGA